MQTSRAKVSHGDLIHQLQDQVIGINFDKIAIKPDMDSVINNSSFKKQPQPAKQNTFFGQPQGVFPQSIFSDNSRFSNGPKLNTQCLFSSLNINKQSNDDNDDLFF